MGVKGGGVVGKGEGRVQDAVHGIVMKHGCQHYTHAAEGTSVVVMDLAEPTHKSQPQQHVLARLLVCLPLPEKHAVQLCHSSFDLSPAKMYVVSCLCKSPTRDYNCLIAVTMIYNTDEFDASQLIELGTSKESHVFCLVLTATRQFIGLIAERVTGVTGWWMS